MGKGNDMPGPDGLVGLGSTFGGNAYAVELLYPQSPPIDADTIAPKVKAFCPQADAADAGGRPPVLFSHRDHLVPIDATTEAPARTVILPTDALTDVAGLHAALGQTRDWDAAADAVARSTSRVVVTDLLASNLAPRERLALFEAVLLGVIEASRPAAIYWKPAGKLVDPASLLKASGSSEVDALPAAAINVRMFAVKNSADALLMDTLGLAALGLPDLQVLFHRMEPGRVAAHLYAIALYTLRHNGLVEQGESVEGATRGQDWIARYGHSIAEPLRPVVDFDPGGDYAVRVN